MPISASGTETYTPNFVPFKSADGNAFLHAANSGFKTGTFTGAQLSDYTLMVFADGSFIFHGIQTFTGIVAGCGTGTVVFRLDGAGHLAAGGAMLTRDHQGAMFGQGTLAVHASLDSSGGPGLTLNYTGVYQCDAS